MHHCFARRSKRNFGLSKSQKARRADGPSTLRLQTLKYLPAWSQCGLLPPEPARLCRTCQRSTRSGCGFSTPTTGGSSPQVQTTRKRLFASSAERRFYLGMRKLPRRKERVLSDGRPVKKIPRARCVLAAFAISPCFARTIGAITTSSSRRPLSTAGRAIFVSLTLSPVSSARPAADGARLSEADQRRR